MLSWLGTTVGGASFGLLLGGVAGVVFGAIFAGVVGAPIHLTFAVVVWLMPFPGTALPLAAAAGGFTGATATALSWDPIMGVAFVGAVILATGIGAAGGLSGGILFTKYFGQLLKVHEPTSAVQESFVRLLARLAAVATIIVGWAWMSTAIYKSRIPLSVPILQERFYEEQAGFEAIVAMIRDDVGLRSIYRDGSYDAHGIERKRVGEYLKLLKKLGLDESAVDVKRNDDDLTITVRPSRAIHENVAIGYTYSTRRPLVVLDAIEGKVVQELRPGESVHFGMGDGWYVFAEKLEFMD